MLVTCQQMSEAEKRLFSSGVDPEPYMDEAGRQCAFAIRQFSPEPGKAEIFCGKGNNGGDALVIARWLKLWGWHITLHFSHGESGLSELAKKKLEQLNETAAPSASEHSGNLICVDGLLGIGATGPLRGGIREMADRINALRHSHWATCYAIDIPTGLGADNGEAYEGAVTADITLTITQAKLGFTQDSAIPYLGRLAEIPLDIPVEEGIEEIGFLFPSNLKPRLIRRGFDTHKGAAGRVLVIAGSPGLTGAATLTSLGASKSGAGLVTVLTDESAYSHIAAQTPAEVMVQPKRDAAFIDTLAPDVIAIGPGLGSSLPDHLIELMLHHPAPMVIDADALNALAMRDINPAELPSNRILTPHPAELKRLTLEKEARVPLTRQLADQWGVTLLHKGARTAVASPGQAVELNTTGHPGMASGGMGDVLTGVCASLVGQGYELHHAACIGSWLLGRSAELATGGGNLAEESVTATAVASRLGQALRELQEGPVY